MIVDTSAIVAMLFKEPGAARYADCLVRHPGSWIGGPNWVEITSVIEGRGDAIARASLQSLVDDGWLQVAPFTVDHAEAAREAWRRFGRKRHPASLNFGDCMAYAVAKLADEPLLYKGNDFAQTDIVSALA